MLETNLDTTEDRQVFYTDGLTSHNPLRPGVKVRFLVARRLEVQDAPQIEPNS